MRYLIILLLLTVSCVQTKHERELYLGELYFAPLRMGSFYNVSDSVKMKFLHIMDTMNIERVDSTDRIFYELFQKIKAESLLYKPFVDLRQSDSTFVKLYLDSSDYNKIKKYKWKDLLESGNKVTLWGRSKYLGRYGGEFRYCTELIEVEVSNGQTYPEKAGKFRIDNYE